MANKRELTCIICPLGCRIDVVTGEDGLIREISGNSCKRGAAYAKEECLDPKRIVTSTVRVKNSHLPVVPVKTGKPVPKALIMDCMREINRITAVAPVRTGDVLIRDILGTGADVVATGNAD